MRNKILSVERVAKKLDFTIKDIKKPIHMWLYRDNSGQAVAMLKTDGMKTSQPVYVLDLPWVLTCLEKKLHQERRKVK